MSTEKVTIGSCTLFCGDCIELLQAIPPKSVDAAIVDPPYFQGINHNGVRSERGDLSISKPFFTQFFSGLLHACKEERAVYVFCDWRSNGFFMETMDDYFNIKNTLVWLKHPGTGLYYQNSYETILIHCNNGRRLALSNVITGIKSFNGGAQVTNGKRVHPTQKPMELMEKLITDSTQQGMTVLDPMMGSGSTGMACIRTGRNFIFTDIFKNTKDRNKILIFCADVAQAILFQRELQRITSDVGLITGETPAHERAELLARFQDKPTGLLQQTEPLRWLVNVNVLTTGFDAPNIDCVVLARPTMSPGLFVQMCGRLLRNAPNKTDGLVLDYGGNIQRHGTIDAVICCQKF